MSEATPEFTVTRPGMYYMVAGSPSVVDNASTMYQLDPDHPSFQYNLNGMTRLQRAYLGALITEVLRGLELALESDIAVEMRRKGLVS